MPSDATDRKLARSQNPVSTHPPPKITESLPCPRCDSASTKFCYYNNYNLCQPRHFCKSCRRYWTQGGTLRNIPVGGGARKNSKRTRTTSSSSSSSSSATVGVAVTTNSSSCSSTVTHEHVPVSANPVSVLPFGNPEMVSVMTTDMNLNESVPGSGSFTNMLNMQVQGQNLLGGFHGYGIGSGFEELELGFGGTRSWEIPGAGYGSGGAVGTSTSGCNTWQMIDSDEQGGNSGGMVGEDCFPWSGLSISTPGKGLK